MPITNTPAYANESNLNRSSRTFQVERHFLLPSHNKLNLNFSRDRKLGDRVSILETAQDDNSICVCHQLAE